MSFYHCYKEHRFVPSTKSIIDQANLYIKEYQKKGYTLILRQLYYRFIAKDSFPNSWIDRQYNIRNRLDPNTKNTIKNYKRLGGIINHGREAGLISWTAFEDRGRTLYGTNPVEDPKDLLSYLEHRLIMDCWKDQPEYIEVYVEKDSLGPIVARPSDEWRVSHMACKGYLSASQAWRAGLRFKAAIDQGKTVTLIHLGDHDPSGQDMTRDNYERLNMFAEAGVAINRIALNMDQIKAKKPPPNPAKVTDSRFAGYVSQYGNDCWELDALEPQELHDLVYKTVESYVDKKIWAKSMEREKRLRARTKRMFDGISANWDTIEEVVTALRNGKKVTLT